MKILITGISGLIGSHLADWLIAERTHELWAFKRWRSAEDNIRHLHGHVRMLEGDITDPYSITHAIELARPDRIFHLAAQSYPGESWVAPAATLEANVLGTLHLLEAARRLVPEAQIHLAGSAASYGLIRPDEVPIMEDRPLRPLSPYGVSKAAQEMLGYQALRAYGQRVYLTRSFIHIGPRQNSRTSAQTFARQIAEAEAGLRPARIEVGNLDPRRDFLDVADVVPALWALLERGVPGEVYNVCSGQAPRIRDLLDIYLDLATMPMEVVVATDRIRPADEPILLGSHDKLSAATGWQPAVPLADSLRRILDYWRAELARRH
ncbi:MAG: GDP-mannose 4,6-dehydratase [Herpetosiphon sp.]